MSRFVSDDFKAPEKYCFGDYYLEPITTKDAVEDWLILTSNANAIVQQRGGGSRDEWPFECTLEENFKDLAWLENCAHYRQLFSYVIREKGGGNYAGCVYIYPIELFYEDLSNKYDVDFSFWTTEEEYKKGKYELIYKELLDWLVKVWKFPREKIYLRNKETSKDLIR